MKNIENKVFSFAVPESFEISFNSEDAIEVHDERIDQKLDTANVFVSIVELEDFNEGEGESLASRFFNTVILYTKGAEPDEERLGELKDGRTCFQLFASSKDKKYFHIALIPVYEKYAVQFFADCPDSLKNKYVSVFSEILESVNLIGKVELLDKIFEKYSYLESVIPVQEEDSNEFKIDAELNFHNKSNDGFEIGGINFSIKGDAKAMISPLTHLMYVDLVIKTEAVEEGLKRGILYEYSQNPGEIVFQFSSNKVFSKNGLYTEFNFLEGNGENHSSRLDIEGMDYPFRFTGKFGFQNNLVGMVGIIKPLYENQPEYPIEVYLPIDISDLKIGNYNFSPLEETQSFNKIDIKRLELNLTDVGEFSDEIFDFKSLEHLSLNLSTRQNEQPIFEFPSGFEKLGELNSLRISNFPVEIFPQEIAQLVKLSNLGFIGSFIKEIPAKVFQLPEMERMYFSGNELTSIPNEIHMPHLKSIDLYYNNLKTLPISLIQQKEINNITVSGNPLESLPEGYNDFAGLTLDFDVKSRVLDNNYAGADGKGMVAWDNKVYYARPETSYYNEISGLLSNDKIEIYKEDILSTVKQSVGFLHSEAEDYSKIGNSRMGGKPDLPFNIPFPSFYSEYQEKECLYEFIAQIDLESISSYQDYLPRKGYLFFFIKSIHHFGEDNSGIVLFVEHSNKLESGKRFLNQKESDFFELPGAEYDSYKLEAFSMVSLPYLYAIQTNKYLFKDDPKGLINDDEAIDYYEMNIFPIMEQEFITDLEVNSYGFTQHESPELQAAIRKKGEPEDWINLLKVKSTGSFQWWDAGEIFFSIHKSDLQKGDFSNIMLTIESS